ncbi:MAG TPA: PxKF domain-containing protein, partial [Terriglobales bacterium]
DLSTGCWTSAAPNTILRSYRSNVTAFMPVSNGSYQPVGTHSVLLPANTYGNGASLVVIYRLMSPNAQPKATVLYEGNWSQEYPPGNTSTFNLNLSGFYDSNATFGSARVTDITGLANTNGTFSFVPAQSQTVPLQMPDASASVAMPNNFAGLQSGQCRLWTATVLSTPVHSSDNDGLIDSWKTAQGYIDATTGAWVDLTGAHPGQRDLFVQLDYMVGADGHSHAPSANALSMVQNALSSHGITPHFVTGNAIPEDTCTGTTTDSSGNTLYCVFPNQAGVVAWKVGLEDLKTTMVDATSCASNPSLSNPACMPRFQFGRRTSYHYVLFGHSLGIANWTINDGTLSNIVVSGGVGTVNLTVPFKTCPTTVTITNAVVNLGLNGTYTVRSCPTNMSFTVPMPIMAAGTYPIPGGVAEPALAVVNGTTGTISGYSDIGGSDSAITLGKWGADGLRDNVVAGTLMHELGHTLGLSHGGSYNGFGSAANYGPNCKPNYQSVMNYLFQIDLLGPNAVVDYSSEVLSDLNKSSLAPGLSTSSNTPPLYSTTSWYAPIPPFGAGTPATRQCDGRLPPPNVYGYLVSGASTPISWLTGQDINFDGNYTENLNGYNDWTWADFRQIGATGNHVLVYPLGLADGIQLSGGGGIQLSGGGGIQLSGGGGIQRTGGGGIQLSGGGGIQLSGGGGIQLAGGGGIQLAGGGGIQLSGGGGIQLAGGGGIQRSGGGGVDAELKFETANAVVRPPRNPVTNGNTITWSAPLFGNITGYNIYCSTNGNAPVLIATVPATQLSYTGSAVQGNCTVTTILTDTSTGTTRESTAPNPPTTRQNQTINFPNPGPLYFNTQSVQLQATATSGLPVTYSVPANNGVCSLSGTNNSVLNIIAAGTCSVTASQAGSSFVFAAQPVTDNIVINPWTIVGFTSPVAMPNPTIVWNVIKGGQTVPLKFNVYIGTAQQTNTSVVVGQSVSIASVACVSGTTNTDTSVTNTGNTSLAWDGSEFIQNWKTPSGSGQCYSATVKTLDSSTITAYFRTK